MPDAVEEHTRDRDRMLRYTLFGVLLTLADRESQLEYARDVPFISVPNELYCQGFDDVYHPDSVEWRDLMSADELSAFAELARIMREHDDAVKPDLMDVIDTAEWKEIMAAAQNAAQVMAKGQTAPP